MARRRQYQCLKCKREFMSEQAMAGRLVFCSEQCCREMALWPLAPEPPVSDTTTDRLDAQDEIIRRLSRAVDDLDRRVATEHSHVLTRLPKMPDRPEEETETPESHARRITGNYLTMRSRNRPEPETPEEDWSWFVAGATVVTTSELNSDKRGQRIPAGTVLNISQIVGEHLCHLSWLSGDRAASRVHRSCLRPAGLEKDPDQ